VADSEAQDKRIDVDSITGTTQLGRESCLPNLPTASRCLEPCVSEIGGEENVESLGWEIKSQHRTRVTEAETGPTCSVENLSMLAKHRF
jgi:hypothetical protein